MSAFTSLLARDQIVPLRKIEEAIQKQVISGGEIESILLEMDLLQENVASAYRAAVYELLPATRDEVMRAPRETVRLVPREIAEQYKIVPLAADGRSLVVAAIAPLAPEADQQLGFLLGYDLVLRIVTEVRIAAALHHYYGVAIEPRSGRLAEKLRVADPGPVPFVAAPSPSMFPTKSGAPPKPSGAHDKPVVRSTDPYGRAYSVPADGAAAASDQAGASASSPAAASVSTRPRSLPPSSADVGISNVVGVGPVPGQSPTPASSVAPAPRSVPPPPPEPAKGPTPRPPAAPPSRRLWRGPLVPKAAVEALAAARSRDEILAVVMAFARQFFDYTALFVVYEETAEGRDASGPGASNNEITKIRVQLDVPSAFGEARRSAQPKLGVMNWSELDRVILRDLHRENAQPSVVFPVVIRGRVPILLYGDRSAERFSIADLPELAAFLLRVPEAFERLIMRKKLGVDAADDAKTTPGARAPKSDAPPDAAPAGGGPVRGRGATLHGIPAAGTEEPSPTSATVAAEGRTSKQTSPGVGLPDPSGLLSLLGVPREAPSPPSASALARAAAASSSSGESEDDGSGRPGSFFEAPEPMAQRPKSEPPAAFTKQRPDGSYRVSDSSEEVLAPRRPSSRPPPREPAQEAAPEPPPPPPSSRAPSVTAEPMAPRRPDPRREDDDAQGQPRDEFVKSSGGVVPPGKRPPSKPAEPSPPRGESRSEPKVIIDMGEGVEPIVRDLSVCGPDDEQPLVQSLLRLGEVALPALVQRFPGTLWFNRHAPHKRLPRGKDVSPIARALVAFRDIAVPYVTPLLSDPDPDIRFYATLLSSELVSAGLVAGLGQRVFDDDAGTRTLSLDVLRLFTEFPEYEEVLRNIRLAAKLKTTDLFRRRVATRALGELRDAGSLALLVALIQEDDLALVEAAEHSLVLLTRHDFGDSHRKWSGWAEKNVGRHRVEWLIDALLVDEEPLRAAAGEELKRLSQEYYGFHAALPKKERERIQRKYATWWNDVGRAKLGGK